MSWNLIIKVYIFMEKNIFSLRCLNICNNLSYALTGSYTYLLTILYFVPIYCFSNFFICINTSHIYLQGSNEYAFVFMLQGHLSTIISFPFWLRFLLQGCSFPSVTRVIHNEKWKEKKKYEYSHEQKKKKVNTSHFSFIHFIKEIH